MTPVLPTCPNLRFLKIQAKMLLRQHTAKKPEVVEILRRLRRFKDAATDTVLNADVTLLDIQYALALTYGFTSWNELRLHILESRKNGAQGVAFKDLRVPNFNTTLLGVISAVADYYDLDSTDAMLFGISGHAFLLNIEKTICPSGPYCWNRKPFIRLLRNLGLEMEELGTFFKDRDPKQRRDIEQVIRQNMAENIPCSILHLEHQLITGFDNTGFSISQPWGDACGGFPPAHLSFGTWAELPAPPPLTIFRFQKVGQANLVTALTDSLEYAVDCFLHSDKHTGENYNTGKQGYVNWLNALKTNQVNDHGNKWNALVWSECRSMAAKFLQDADALLPELGLETLGIAALYAKAADNIRQVASKELSLGEKSMLVEKALELETEAIGKIKSFIPTLRRIITES